MDAQQILTAISSSIAIMKELSGIVSKSPDHELKEKFASMREQLFEVRMSLQDVLEENRTLKEKLEHLSKPPETKFGDDGLVYNLAGEGPFCPTCFATTGKLISIPPHPIRPSMRMCSNCEGFFRR